MPLVGATPGSTVIGAPPGATVFVPSSWDVQEYSHSGVFTTTRSTVIVENAPPLLTRWTPRESCRNRWMMVDNGSNATTGFVQTRTITAEPQVTSSPSPPQRAVVVLENRQADGAEGTPTIRFRFTAWSIDNDPLFSSCQPYQDQPLYSPGVCPEGHEVVEVTEIHATKTDGGLDTSWQASCCSSGMTFGSDVSRFCQSTIGSPLVAHALITMTYDSKSAPSQIYEYDTVVDGTDTTISNLTSLATGLAVADYIVVAWNLQEMSSFLADYRTSLASKVGVALETGVAPGKTSGVPKETGDAASTANSSPTVNSSLSTGAKAGIGICAVLGVALCIGIIVLLWLRKRKQSPTDESGQVIVAEMADQDEINARRRWFFGGRWRNEAEARPKPAAELDSKVVHVVPGPPAELDSAQVRHNEAIE